MEEDTRVYNAGAVASLRVVQGPGAGTVLIVRRGVYVVGRGDTCELVIPDPTTSRQHARVTRGPQGTELADLGSTNGTYVNGRRVVRCLLRHGDRVQVGGAVLEYRELP